MITPMPPGTGAIPNMPAKCLECGLLIDAGAGIVFEGGEMAVETTGGSVSEAGATVAARLQLK